MEDEYKTRIAKLETDQQVLLKKIAKMERANRKAEKEANPDRPKRETAFTRPTILSEELCSFLDLPNGTKLARTEVTTRISKYVREKELSNPENKREILLDAPLKSLMGVDVIQWLQMQKYLKPHFLPTPATDDAPPKQEPEPAKPAKEEKVVKKVVKKVKTPKA